MLAEALASIRQMGDGRIERLGNHHTIYSQLFYRQPCGTSPEVARVRFERTASDSLEVRGLPIAYRAAVAGARFELSAPLGFEQVRSAYCLPSHKYPR